jgi:tRNA(fMet)-specific endonuclease VapC
VPFDEVDTAQYAVLRHELETAGIVMGSYDLLIAAICLRHGFVLVTNNVNEFSRVRDLKVEDWLQSAR